MIDDFLNVNDAIELRLEELLYWSEHLPPDCGQDESDCTCERSLFRRASGTLFMAEDAINDAKTELDETGEMGKRTARKASAALDIVYTPIMRPL